MKSNNNYNSVTTTYKYNSHEEEFVFCYKTRPFAILSSSFFPVPNCSYIDHHLIMELGMKMSDVGCKKICFAGKKLRMLGKVSFTAQCVKDGGVFGNFHVKATVIEDLKYHFDTHGIAGSKMTALLHGHLVDNFSSSLSLSSPTQSSPRATSRHTPDRRGTSPHTPYRRGTSPHTPNPRGTSRHISPSSEGASSPPGFPDYPQHPPPDDLNPNKPNHGRRRLLISNLNLLNEMFGGADTQESVKEEREVLEDHVGGSEDTNQPQFSFVTSMDNHYHSGHGRTKCRFDVCSANWEVPENCGFAADNWSFPDDFRPCSSRCRGAFCKCIDQL